MPTKQVRCVHCGGTGRDIVATRQGGVTSGGMCWGCSGRGFNEVFVPNPKPQSGKTGSGGCFIATAAYGSPTARG